MLRRAVGLRLICAALGLYGAIGVALAQEHAVGPAIDKPVTDAGQDAGTGDGQDEAAQEETSASRIEPALKAIEAAIRELIAEDNTEERQRQEKREEADLQAQKDMALWAKRMTRATWAGVALTFVGVALIAWTLRHTKRAADAAVAMLDEAKKTTESTAAAAREAATANQLQNVVFVAGNRPWVVLQPPTITSSLTWDENMCNITFEFLAQNIGRTPTKDALLVARLYINEPTLLCERDAILAEIRQEARRDSRLLRGRTIFPRETGRWPSHTLLIDRRLLDGYFEEIGRDGWAEKVSFMPILAGCIDYGNVFNGKRNQTAFIYEVERLPNEFGETGIGPTFGEIPADQLVLKEDMAEGGRVAD